jgi:hypothetical protein
MFHPTSLSLVISVAVAVLVATPIESQQLNDLIKQNVQDATGSYQKLADNNNGNAAQLWVQVRSDAQRSLIIGNLAWLNGISLNGNKIEVPPVEIVKSGPQENQLRFFNRQDRDAVKELFASLKGGIPQLQLQDMSRAYGGVKSLKPGHFELWLAPSLDKIEKVVKPIIPVSFGTNVTAILRSYLPERDLFIANNIPAKKLQDALSARTTSKPESVEVVGLLDATDWGSAAVHLLFTGKGLYFRTSALNSIGAREGYLGYEEFPRLTFGKAAFQEVALGVSQSFDVSGSSIGVEKLVRLLNELKAAVQALPTEGF